MSAGIRIESATIRILRTEFGRFPHILPLNSELRSGSPSLRVTLEVEWAPPDAIPLLRRYQQELAGLLPELGRHRCRGPAHYHFSKMGEEEAAPASGTESRHPNGVEPARAPLTGSRHMGGIRPAPVNGTDRIRTNGIEPALALVHLAEHLAIDVIAYVTEIDSVSGVTAALGSSEKRFELFVECPR